MSQDTDTESQIERAMKAYERGKLCLLPDAALRAAMYDLLAGTFREHVKAQEPSPCSQPLREITARIYKRDDVIVSIHDLLQYVDEVRINGTGDVTHAVRP